MAYKEEDRRAATTKGKYWGIFICWLLGNGCLFGFNSMLIILDYYMHLFPNYHSAKVITVAYQPFVLSTTWHSPIMRQRSILGCAFWQGTCCSS
ncbi:unnamed protein product [Urochloa humidicola]